MVRVRVGRAEPVLRVLIVANQYGKVRHHANARHPGDPYSYEIGIDSRMFARFITRSRVSLIFDAAYSKPEITPFNTPNSRKATAIDRTVRTVRIGLRHRPAHSSGKYFIV